MDELGTFVLTLVLVGLAGYVIGLSEGAACERTVEHAALVRDGERLEELRKENTPLRSRGVAIHDRKRQAGSGWPNGSTTRVSLANRGNTVSKQQQAS